MGLAIAKAYVQLLGGHISFNSKPNVGSEFYFTIPTKFILENKNIEVKNENREMLDMLELLYSNVDNDLTDGYFLRNLKRLIEKVKNEH